MILNPIKVDDPAQFRTLVETLADRLRLRLGGLVGDHAWRTPATAWPTRRPSAAATLVLAIGGDGTIRAVCEELAGTGIPVGIVPAGTGNLLARNLDIPLYLRSAVDVGLNGQDRAIDMVEVSGDKMEDATFLVMAGMGFDAAIMEGVNEDIKAKVGWLAYVWSALKSLMFPAIRVEVSVDGGEFTRHRARTIVVGNVGFLQGGMPLIPDAAIDDGQLDVVLLYPRRFLSWVPARGPRADQEQAHRRADHPDDRPRGRRTRQQRRPPPARRRPDRPRQGDPRPVRARAVAGAGASAEARFHWFTSETGADHPLQRWVGAGFGWSYAAPQGRAWEIASSSSGESWVSLVQSATFLA